jgi:hypothetical protein
MAFIYRINTRLIFGLLLLAFGVLFFLEDSHLPGVGTILHNFWPLAIIVVGLAKFAESANAHGRIVGLLWAGLGGLWLAHRLNYIEVKALPLALVLLGAYFVWRAVWIPSSDTREDGAQTTRVEATAILGGAKRTVRSQDFRGGSLTAVMGGCELDLREAQITGNEAVIDVFAFWGGIEIKAPADWEIESRGIAILGGFGEQNKREREGARPPSKRLIITGMVIMGGAEIKAY